MENIRVRFAPSPTGTLHIGGVRTLLYNYLLARRYAGKLIIRIEDTDKNRYVEGAEEYICKTLEWLDIVPDESPWHGGDFGPYRQSERLDNYRQIAQDLVNKGYAYYAFDKKEDLEKMRLETMTRKYDAHTRMAMLNSLTMSSEQVQEYFANNHPYVIRLLTPDNEEPIIIEDLLRGEMEFSSDTWEDKILLKEDGYPTYHLAAVVDDLDMQITHILRGEEWLPSLPVHTLLWRYLKAEKQMPKWIHLPLLLRPYGAGKLSKRDGIELGIPIIPLATTNPPMQGFREEGFLPDALINALVLSAWHSQDDKEIFTRKELIESFSLKGLNYQSVKFDIDKTKWVNLQHLRQLSDIALKDILTEQLQVKHNYSQEQILAIVQNTRERYTSYADIWDNVAYFFIPPQSWDFSSLVGKYTPALQNLLQEFVQAVEKLVDADNISEDFCRQFFSLERLTQYKVKMGILQLALRILLVGEKKGIAVFSIISLLYKEDFLSRLYLGLRKFEQELLN